MIREERVGVWQCGHRHPALVTTSDAGRRARCLGCGTIGPWRASLAEALRALKLRQEILGGSPQSGPQRPGSPVVKLEDGRPTG